MSRVIAVVEKPRLYRQRGLWHCAGLKSYRLFFFWSELLPDFGCGETPEEAYEAWKEGWTH